MARDLADGPPQSFAFGPFVLILERQLLLENEVPVRIGGRALDILTALLEHAGELVSKGDLLSRVWPDTIVEDSRPVLRASRLAVRSRRGTGT